MRKQGYMTGMQGVYLVAAELTKRGFVVSPTSRNAFGADLLVTDQECKHAWSVQVKANFGRPTFWLLSKHSLQTRSRTHLYVLVNLGQKNDRQKDEGPDFYVVPSRILAERMQATTIKKGQTRPVFYSVHRHRVEKYKDRWGVFGTALRRTS